MEMKIGRQLQPSDVAKNVLGPQQELMPDNPFSRKQIESLALMQLEEFTKLVVEILSGKKHDEQKRQVQATFWLGNPFRIQNASSEELKRS